MKKEIMKIFEVDFKPIWPVPSGLIIAANNKEEAENLAEETLKNAGIDSEFHVREVEISVDEPTVVFFESGDY
jgi:hypothetical protein